jgi:hypothetical protein
MKKEIKILPLNPSTPRCKEVKKIPLNPINEENTDQYDINMKDDIYMLDSDSIYVPIKKKD